VDFATVNVFNIAPNTEKLRDLQARPALAPFWPV